MNSENPQYDARQFDAQQHDAQYEGGHDASPDAQGDAPHSDEPGGPPYRAIAMVLLSAVVLAVGVGLVQLFGGDDDEAVTADEGTSQVEQQGQTAGDQGAEGQVGPDGQPLSPGADAGDPAAPGAPGELGPDGQPVAQPGEQPGAEPGGAGQVPAGSVPGVTNVPVVIYNNSTVTGLAGRTGEQLRESGFAVGDVANLPSNRGVVPESTAFYGSGPGEREAAQAIGEQLGIAVEPRPADMAAEGPGVIVIVTQDLDR